MAGDSSRTTARTAPGGRSGHPDDADETANTAVEKTSEYVAWIARGGLAANTKRAYTRQVASFGRWPAGQDRPEALTDPHERDYAVRDYKEALLEGGSAPKSVQLALTAVQSFYVWTGLGPADVRQVRIPPGGPRTLEPEETRRVLRAAERRGLRDLAIVATTLMCGPRLAELHALHVDDTEIHARSGWLRIRVGKGCRPRDVPIKTGLRPILSRRIAARRDRTGTDLPHLWLSSYGRQLAKSSIDRVMDGTGAAAGVDMSAHTLRHTFADDNLRAGVDPATVATWLGHDDLRTLLVYGRPTARAQEAMAEVVTYPF